MYTSLSHNRIPIESTHLYSFIMNSERKFGGLGMNSGAAEARHVMKFFDSAEWAVQPNRDGSVTAPHAYNGSDAQSMESDESVPLSPIAMADGLL